MATGQTTTAPRPSRVRRLAFRTAAVFLSLALTAAAAEGLARVVLPPTLTALRDATTDWQPHPRLGWVQKPNLDLTTQESGGQTLRFCTNADGLTPPTAERAKAKGVLRVMIFGDSSAVGRSVLQEESVNAHLERLL